MKRSRVPRDYFDDDDDDDFEMVARTTLPSASARLSVEPTAVEEDDPLDAFMRMNERQVAEESQQTQRLPEIVSIETGLEDDELSPRVAGKDLDLEGDEIQVLSDAGLVVS